MRWASLAATVAAISASACSSGAHRSPPQNSISFNISAVALMRTVRELTAPELNGRGSGSADEAAAASYIDGRLRSLGIAATLQPFQRGSVNSANIVVRIPGSAASETIVVGAHYDHLGKQPDGIYWGAEDNASGVAALLALAPLLEQQQSKLARTIVMVFFGAEEVGLQGSHHFVEIWDWRMPITHMINVDMIGRPLVDNPMLWLLARTTGALSDVDPKRAVGVFSSPGLAEQVKQVSAQFDVRSVFVEDLPPSLQETVRASAQGRGDFAPFEARGVPFVFFSSGESTDYHKPSDTAETLHPDILLARTQVIYCWLSHVAAATPLAGCR